jgi:hypothetical protein
MASTPALVALPVKVLAKILDHVLATTTHEQDLFAIPPIAQTNTRLRAAALPIWLASQPITTATTKVLHLPLEATKLDHFWAIYQGIRPFLKGIIKLTVLVEEEDPQARCTRKHEAAEEEAACGWLHWEDECPPAVQRLAELEDALNKDCPELEGVTIVWMEQERYEWKTFDREEAEW